MSLENYSLRQLRNEIERRGDFLILEKKDPEIEPPKHHKAYWYHHVTKDNYPRTGFYQIYFEEHTKKWAMYDGEGGREEFEYHFYKDLDYYIDLEIQ